MAAQPSLSQVQAQFDALVELVNHQAESLQNLEPTREEQSQIKAVIEAWSKTICCLNRSAARVHSGRVLQFLQQRINILRTALADKRALRFDVLVLDIASCSVYVDVYLEMTQLTLPVQVPLSLSILLENIAGHSLHASLIDPNARRHYNSN